MSTPPPAHDPGHPPDPGPVPGVEPPDGIPIEPDAPPGGAPGPDPLGPLPRVARRHARLEMRLRRADEALTRVLGQLSALLGPGVSPTLSRAEVLPRASGLNRPGAIAQFGWPRLGTRVGLGVEPALAHAIVDRLLGFERPEPEHRLQVSPVEWGVLGFVLARLLDRLADRPGALGPWDLYLDRLGPEPFRTDDLGPIVTLAWPMHVPPARGALRFWVPEVLVALAMVDEPPPALPSIDPDDLGPGGRFGPMVVSGVARAGTISPPGGLAGLTVGATVPIDGSPLKGSPESPEGAVTVVLGGGLGPHRWAVPAGLVPDSDASRLVVTGLISRRPRPQEAIPVPPSREHPDPDRDPSPSTNPDLGVRAVPVPDLGPTGDTLLPDDIPATLVVELGRLSLSLARVADLKPGDVLDLSRAGTDPVELTSGDALVARGELVRMDHSLGVRITRVFL
ncbi:FliM/FliN family flagellar motor switch protein [Tautonia plasticadhaerens]|uniref:Type III secretion system protein n=1 Tax=Tautonia plasticadhaerens TaxID=2527974 RepID=A0A518H325_9BACT|nr:FliM/FliN family flagellar motor switch protein [Tautonia plasticadhaerens]QDV35244.1 type III secretion system protein [Tautonia plasticadhaerens]